MAIVSGHSRRPKLHENGQGVLQADRPAQVESIGKALCDLLEHQDVAEAAREDGEFPTLHILDRDRGLRLIGLSQVRRQRDD